MPVHSTGIQTSRDDLVIAFSEQELLAKIQAFVDPTASDALVRERFFAGRSGKKYPKGDTRQWSLSVARKALLLKDHRRYISDINYRPFDVRKYYNDHEMIDWPRAKVMRNCAPNNICLLLPRQLAGDEFFHAFCSRLPSEMCVISAKTTEQNYVFPLWLEPESAIDERRPNLDREIYKRMTEIVADLTPETFFNYIYAILYSPQYRTTYAEYLKAGFPFIPYPTSHSQFLELAMLGGELRDVHLMEGNSIKQLITAFPVSGTMLVKAIKFEPSPFGHVGRVWINEQQYFDQVPKVSWEARIGAYKPCQKWLTERHGRALTSDDVKHWQRIVVAMFETHRIMRQIDAVDL